MAKFIVNGEQKLTIFVDSKVIDFEGGFFVCKDEKLCEKIRNHNWYGAYFREENITKEKKALAQILVKTVAEARELLVEKYEGKVGYLQTKKQCIDFGKEHELEIVFE
ncbi:MAG: hypothetical protein LBM67_08450 [Lentimicrobiaceae bacterium]|jgi:hypothetical protein|nr:hypothetical protein [Lentimicrobiaceae bacterium]